MQLSCGVELEFTCDTILADAAADEQICKLDRSWCGKGYLVNLGQMQWSRPAGMDSQADEEQSMVELSSSLHVKDVTDLATLSADDVLRFAEGTVYDICNNDALCITEQAVLDQVFSLVNGIKHLPSVARRRLIDGLCSNLSVLSVSTHALIGARPSAASAAATDSGGGAEQQDMGEASQEQELFLDTHRTAHRAYLFLLHSIVKQLEKEAKEEAAAAAAPAARAAKGATRKKGASDLAVWDWPAHRERAVRAARTVADIDLVKLFAPKPVDDSLLQDWVHTAVLALDSTTGARAQTVRESAARILGCAAAKHGQLDAIGGALVDALNRNEAVASAAAAVCKIAGACFGDDRLAVELLRQVTAVSPSEYEQQAAHNDTAGVRNVAVFIVELAEQMPHTVAAHMAMLAPHLGGKAYPLRSAIISAAGHLLIHAYSDQSTQAPHASAGAQGQANWLRAKQALLDLLTERVRDQTAYTRARTLHTWALLAEKTAIPLGHWLLVTKLAIGRLEDKAAIVRRAALQLLGTLLASNPFAPTLALPAFQASLHDFQQQLQAVSPEDGDEAGEGGSRDEAEWDQGEVAIDASGSAQPATQDQTPADGDQDMPAAMDASEDSSQVPPDSQIPEDSQAPQDSQMSTQGDSQPGEQRNVQQLRHLVASLRVATDFAEMVGGMLSTLGNLLGSATLSDVQEALALVITCRQFQVTGAQALLRKMLALVFAREQGAKEALVEAVDVLYLKDCTSETAARNLVDLACGATLGELSALEELMGLLLKRDKPLLSQQVSLVVGTLAVISMAAAAQPKILERNIAQLLKIGYASGAANPLATRYACSALRHLPNALSNDSVLGQQQLQPAFQMCVQVLLDGHMPLQGWFSCSEAAVSVLYALHPAPQDVCGRVVQLLATRALPAAGSSGQADTSQLARLLFVVGHVALCQLVHLESSVSKIRHAALAAERAAADAESHPGGKQAEDIAAELGVGAATSDLELDSLKEVAEAQILDHDYLIGRFGNLTAHVCHSSGMRAADPDLRAAALLALTKLMAVDPDYCDSNLQLLFTLLHAKGVDAGVRSNVVIALGDLAVRFPNVLEPWTPNMYQPLTDSDPGVRKTALMVLSHLILNDMMKVKGHIARLALCLRDSEPRIADLAALFFHELNAKASKGSNPIYNLLPDILSSLSAEAGLTPTNFQAIMHTLLAYIAKDKHADSLADKLLPRFEGASSQLSRNLAFCLSQLAFTEKGVRRVMEHWPSYQGHLGDQNVLEIFQGLISKARKLAKQSAELKGDLGAYEEKLLAAAAALAEPAENAEPTDSAAEATEQDTADEQPVDTPMQNADAEQGGSQNGDDKADQENDTGASQPAEVRTTLNLEEPAHSGDSMSEGEEEKSNQQIAFEKQIGGASHNLPRTARARVGATTDPLPEGKKVAEPVLHGDIKPAGHDQDRAAGGGAPGEGTSEDYKAMQKEVQASGAADAKSHPAANATKAHKDPVSSSGNMHGREGKY
ncbi:hypothetical protein WJX73_005287 [Symbiochloris irregularis]|uniref:Condensin-1 complex subunit CAP-D2 n=1 Tax=Symbiochloris irregularis TaxID=706552 RepID=A0AAW1NU89_9CHLO